MYISDRSFTGWVVWFAINTFHNVVVHPLLPLADCLALTPLYPAAAAIDWLHDLTTPDERG